MRKVMGRTIASEEETSLGMRTARKKGRLEAMVCVFRPMYPPPTLVVRIRKEVMLSLRPKLILASPQASVLINGFQYRVSRKSVRCVGAWAWVGCAGGVGAVLAWA